MFFSVHTKRLLIAGTCFAAAFASASLRATPPSDSDEAPGKRFQIAAVSLDEAIAQFDQVCMRTFPDRDEFTAALKTSDWKYDKVIREDQPDRQEWSSSRGYATYVPVGKMVRGAAVPQCNFDAALTNGFTRQAIVTALEALLRQHFGNVPPRVEADNSIYWSWTLDEPYSARLYVITSLAQDQRQLTLSLQTWDPALESALEDLVRRGSR